jgi:hypothetical protein
MAQGSTKNRGSTPQLKKTTNKSCKIVKRTVKAASAKVGKSINQLPKGRFRESAIDDRLLTKEINKSSEQKVAAKLIQSGGKLTTSDILSKGKELNKAQRRSQVKRKVSKVELQLKALNEKAEREGH